MNEAGNVLVNFEMPDKDGEQTKEVEIETISVLNGLIYITTSERVEKERNGSWYEEIYVIDPNTSSVKSSMRAPARMEINSTIVEQGDRLNIQVS